MLVPGFFNAGFFTDLGALYVFGSLLCFALAHAAVLGLRAKKPDLPRPFKLRLNIRIKGREFPLSAILGLISTMVILVVIIIIQPFSRWSGLAWMIIGIFVYGIYRRVKHLPLTHLTQGGQLTKK
jgi:APA family basic amino acid/polyamine antiporter